MLTLPRVLESPAPLEGSNRLPPAKLAPGGVGVKLTLWVSTQCALPGATEPRLNWPVALGEPRQVGEPLMSDE